MYYLVKLVVQKSPICSFAQNSLWNVVDNFLSFCSHLFLSCFHSERIPEDAWSTLVVFILGGVRSWTEVWEQTGPYDCEFDRCPCLWPSALNSRGAELQIWVCAIPAAPSRAEKETPGQRLRLRCREAASGLYSFNLWWMRSEERSCADKYESVWLGRSSIMPAAANVRSCGWNGSLWYKKAISQKIGMY